MNSNNTKKTPVDLLLEADWIIPVKPANTVLEKHAIVVHEGKIHDILPQASAHEKYQPERHKRLNGQALIPGLINAHTHVPMNLLRGLADDLELMTWLNDHIWPAEKKFVSPQFVEDGSKSAIMELLRGGVTCFNDSYFFPDVVAGVARHAGIRAVIGMLVIEFPTAWAHTTEEYFDKGLALHDEWRNDALVKPVWAPHAPYTVSDASFEKIRTYSDQLNLRVHIHVHESASEIKGSLEQYGVRPLERMKSLGLVNNNLIAVHMTQLTEEEMDLCAKSGVHIVHCPESNMKLASGTCPVAALEARNINLGLGTDGAASNNDLDMIGEMRTAAMLAKVSSGDPESLPAHRALHMATLGGATALGLDEICGSLEIGKAADIVAVDMNTPDVEPVYHLISHLVYCVSRQQVSHVWINGQCVLDERQLTTLNENDIRQQSREWSNRIREAL